MIERLKVILFMVVLAGVFGAGITAISLYSKPIIEANNAYLKQKAQAELFGLCDVKTTPKKEIVDIVKSRVVIEDDYCTDPVSGKTFRLYTAYKTADKNEVQAYAFEYRGIGFWAPIEGLLAVNTEMTKTIGMIVTQQAETPGLGGRIEEDFFTQPFRDGITITKPANENGQYIYMATGGNRASQGAPQYGREFDAITGATQTSMAMERTLQNDVAQFARAMQNKKAGE